MRPHSVLSGAYASGLHANITRIALCITCTVNALYDTVYEISNEVYSSPAYPLRAKLAEKVVVFGQQALTLLNLDQHCWLVVHSGREDLHFTWG